MKRFLIIAAGVVTIALFSYATVNTYQSFQQKIDARDRSIKLKEAEYRKIQLEKSDVEKKLLESQRTQSESERKIKENEEKQRSLEKQLQAKRSTKATLASSSSTPSGGYSGNVEQLVRKVARHYGIGEDYFVGVADCESTMGKNLVNTGYTAGGGHPSGLFQYLPETWNRISSRSPYGTIPFSEVMDMEKNAWLTGWAYANGYSGEWACA